MVYFQIYGRSIQNSPAGTPKNVAPPYKGIQPIATISRLMFHLTLNILTILNAAQKYIVVSIQPRAKPRTKPRLKPRIKPRAISRDIFFQIFLENFSIFFEKMLFFIYTFSKKIQKVFKTKFWKIAHGSRVMKNPEE